jgi:hypothetical protein
MEEVVGSTPISSTTIFAALHLPNEESLMIEYVCRKHGTLALLAILFLLLIAFLNAVGATGASDSQMPDVLVWVDARSVSGHSISMTYPKVVSRAKAEAHLHSLLDATGWVQTNVKITDASLEKSGANPMTSAEFVTSQAVRIESGVFPIEPIITALRDLKKVEVLFMVPSAFRFKGLRDYEDRYVTVRLRRSVDAYTYSVRIKDSSFQTLGLPTSSEQGQASAPGFGKLTAVLTVVLLAVLAAAAAYLITCRLTGNRRRRSSPRS